ncbi:sensor histidine kinase, partial [bacterium]
MHRGGAGKTLKSQKAAGACDKIFTDITLVTRVLINMGKNAFEATLPGGKVEMRFDCQGKKPIFTVHNEGFIPE